MNIIAHKSKDGREQSLQEHSQNVSRMAVSFAAPFGGEKLAERIGLSHDAGKNAMGFQQYIRNPGKYAKSPHAVIGATLNGIAGDFPSAVIVEGHHSGLHNMCDTRSNLNAALAERGQDVVKAQEYFSTDAISQTAVFPEFARKNRVLGQFSFIKMEFSCLTDADYQDTERFMHGYSPRSYDYDSFSDIYDMFRKHIQPWIDKDNKMVKENDQPLTKDEEINHMRTQMMLQCLDAGSNSRKGDIRTLSIPTGGSKTLSSFAYAIAAAKKDTSIKRIIVVIPFNTITTQTASVLRGIVGEKNILENHSGFDFEDSKQGKLLQYASENWDIPIVVTTNVQFFESFFSNKPAKSRKLHNIADSVIIFDEVQQLPVKYLKPCIKCIESLAANFGARIVLSTATQPALEPYFETIKPREIIDDSESYVKPFRRCSIENIGTVTAKNLTERIQKHKQCLCVVNEKEEAKAIYTAIENGRCKNLYCLTTDITPYDREKLLRKIKKERITQNGYNEGRGQRSRECLVNVRYTIIVYLVQMNTMQEGMNLDKYYEMLTKYINGGCGNKVPYLGIAMDPMNFKLINSDDIKPTQPFNEDLGFMPFTEDYTKPKDPDLVCRHLTIENGIIDFTKGEYFHCYEGLT